MPFWTIDVPSAFTSSHNPFFIYKDISTSVGFSVFISILFLPTAFKYEEDQRRGNDVVSSRLQGLILYGSSSSWNVGWALLQSISTKFLRHCNSATSHVNKWVPALLSGSQPSNCTSPYVRLTGLLRIFFDTCLGWFVSEMGCTANKTNGPARPGSTWFPWWLLSPYTEPQGVFCNCIFYFIFKFKIIF